MTRKILDRAPWPAGATALAFAVLLTGCIGDTITAPTVHDVDFAAQFNVNLDEMVERPSGIWFRDDVEGDGDLEADWGHDVTLHYDGYLYDGTHFESTPANEPLEFWIGDHTIIAGFQEGVIGMREGGSRLVLVPPHLAFGDQGSADGVVPPDTWMVFELHVFKVEGELF